MTMITFPNAAAISTHLQTDEKFPHKTVFQPHEYYGEHGLLKKIASLFANETRFYPLGVQIGVQNAMRDSETLTGNTHLDDMIIQDVTESLGRLAGVDSDTAMRTAQS